MADYPSPLVTDRWHEFERRLARLEALLGSGVSGTDQTIKGSHDRLDSLLGAGVSGLAEVVIRTFDKELVDNVLTNVFTVTTPDLGGSGEGGAWVAFVFTRIDHGASAASTAAAAKSHLCTMAHANEDDGTAANSGVTEIDESASAATDAPTRDIGVVSCTMTGATNYVTTVEFTADATGASVGTLQARCLVILIWAGYATAPIMAAA